ncbi:MAG TPA: 3-methyl-2-oxobutanoate hydroxymethyltransferase [Vicinamibacterales bacterium]|nr:3-methyl-2-oxobutanoate hydroxymethyltransferase [Vicinamibacterales bacterium]
MMKPSLVDLTALKQRHQKITMITAYDAPSARFAEIAGVDAILIGDSAAMTVFGYDETTAITLEEMLLLSRAVRRGAVRPLLVADMPFGSVQGSDVDMIANAARFVKEAGVDAVKIEGAGAMVRRIQAVIDAGVPVVGHIGLTPQSASQLGGYKPQGRTASAAAGLVDDAGALERAGCVAIVLEAIPPPVAAAITRSLTIPTIGIGAGAECDGQVLVWHDALGLSDRTPKFVKQYAGLGHEIVSALRTYVDDVHAGRFPDPQHTYAMPDDERERFEKASQDLSATKS